MRTVSPRVATTLAAALLLSSIGTVAAAKGQNVQSQSQNTYDTHLTLAVLPSTVSVGDTVDLSGALTWINRGDNETEYDRGGDIDVWAATSEEACGTGVMVATAVTDEDGEYTASFVAEAAGTYWVQAVFGGDQAGSGNTWLSSASACVELTVVGASEGRDAPAIANEHLGDQNEGYVAQCKELNGTNENKNNWHGRVISAVAQEFKDQSFTESEESIVTDFVDGLCGFGDD